MRQFRPNGVTFFALAIALGVAMVAVQLSGAARPAPSVGGRAVYMANCSACHGAAGQGAVNIAPPLARNPYVTGSSQTVIRIVLNGFAGPVRERGTTWSGSMPGWRGTLSSAQIASVVTYVRGSWGNRASAVTERDVALALRAAAPRAAPARPAPSNHVIGESLYATNCSSCHGTHGQGAINVAPPLARNPLVTGNPQNVIHVVADGLGGPVTERFATWNGSMPAWRGTLSDAQLAAVITYIRTSWDNRAAPVTEKQVSAVR